MHRLIEKPSTLSWVFPLALLIVVGCSTTNGSSQQGIKVTLTGDKEVPPVKTSGSGVGNFIVNADKSISGTVTTTGVDGSVAHIHDSAPGQMCGAKNGPVIIPLTKGTDNNTWTVPAGSKLNDAQYASYQAGRLYVNVHTAANKSGEICAQLTPPK